MSTDARRIAAVKLDEASLAATSADAEHERRVAIFDLLEANDFQLVDGPPGPYSLALSAPDGRLVIEVSLADGASAANLSLSLDPFRRVIKDYFMICESYYEAIRTASPDRIEAIDMGRRGLHNEGSEMLAERLKASAVFDFDTARRLFTLVCALHRPR